MIFIQFIGSVSQISIPNTMYKSKRERDYAWKWEFKWELKQCHSHVTFTLLLRQKVNHTTIWSTNHLVNHLEDDCKIAMQYLLHVGNLSFNDYDEAFLVRLN